MKRVALDSSFRLQSLMQDFQELHKEIESSRNKLENTKQRKGTLRVEIRFLRRRYKYLIKSKALTQERGKELVQQHNVEDQRKKIVKVQIPNKKEAALRDLPPVFKPNNKKRVYSGNEIYLPNKIPKFDPNHKGKHYSRKNATCFNPMTISKLNPKGRLFRGKEVAPRQTPIMMIDLNKQKNTCNGSSLAAMHTQASVIDLSQKEANFVDKQTTDQIRAPIFDLNQRLVEEEEYQESCEMLRQDKLSDLKLSLCRNIGDGSSRVVKRRISWQDPVALRV